MTFITSLSSIILVILCSPYLLFVCKAKYVLKEMKRHEELHSIDVENLPQNSQIQKLEDIFCRFKGIVLWWKYCGKWSLVGIISRWIAHDYCEAMRLSEYDPIPIGTSSITGTSYRPNPIYTLQYRNFKKAIQALIDIKEMISIFKVD